MTKTTVDVAQLVEPRIVIPAVVGSSPIVHPIFLRQGSGPLAQLVEQWTLNPLVGGSIPSRPTIDSTSRATVPFGRPLARAAFCAVVAAVMLVFPASRLHAQPREAVAAPSSSREVSAERLGDGPIIYKGMAGLEGELGDNIDGPSVIKAPSWLKSPLGKYYMYFAHHRGEYIRLAYADRPEGPWKIYGPGTLHLSQMTRCFNHVASPDVIVDDQHQRLVLYFHCPIETVGVKRDRPYAQLTFVATSKDGVNFDPNQEACADPYLRAFLYQGYTYALAMSDKKTAYPIWKRSGRFFRSATGMPPFEAGPRILDEMRHAALLRRGDVLHIFYTVVGDDPERIYHSQVDLRPDWTEWTATAPTEVLRPERAYEGADLPLTQSKGGMSAGRERALRDPAVLDDDGRLYLYYTVAGEVGIAVAQVRLGRQ